MNPHIGGARTRWGTGGDDALRQSPARRLSDIDAGFTRNGRSRVAINMPTILILPGALTVAADWQSEPVTAGDTGYVPEASR